MQTGEPTTDLLVFDNVYSRADTGKRLVNYILDVLSFYVLVFLFGVFMAIVSPASANTLFVDNSLSPIADRILTFVCYAFYMSIMEAVFKGKSLGKLITKTRAVNLDGSRISTAAAFARGFSRAVPFCVLSAFGTPCHPWQDRWTNTMVIDERETVLQTKLDREDAKRIKPIR
jgi:uncharacterized RDD family membrane protein YckC